MVAKKDSLLDNMNHGEPELVRLVERRKLWHDNSQVHLAQSSSYFTVNGTLYRLSFDSTAGRGLLVKWPTRESLGFKILCTPGKMNPQSRMQQVQLDNYMHSFYRSDLGIIFQALCEKGVSALSGDL